MDAAHGRAWANPASAHAAGRQARALLEQARRAVARAIGAEPADVILTSGGTEACNLGLLGLTTPRTLIGTGIAHPAVTAPLGLLRARGASSIRLAVPAGRPPAAIDLESAIGSTTTLCAFGWVNHETGTILPVADYAAICRGLGARLFIDATQAFGKLPVALDRLHGVDLMALASHKIGGPAGAGALWVRRGTELASLLHGGAQERGRRAGSPDVLAAVGFGAACEALAQRLGQLPRLSELRGRLEHAVVELGGVLNATAGERVATVVSASFRGQRGDELVAALDLEGICVSSGAACSSGLHEPSPVLRAMYPDEPWRAESTLRFSFGPETTELEIESAIDALARVVERRQA